MKKKWFVLVVAVAAFTLPGAVSQPANAEGANVIRFATLAPVGSAFYKVMQAWNRSLIKETDGRVKMRFYGGGSQGDERDFMRKIRAGQMDAAGVTTVGLGAVVRPVLVLGAPGVITKYDQLKRVRSQLNSRFDKMFSDAGFRMLAWGDAGLTRLFSTEKFESPEDIKSRRPWAWKDDPVFAELMKVIGANPVRIGLPEVYPGLQTRMIDTVPASAIAAVALQWYTRLNYMSKDHFGIIVGASVIKQEKFDELSEGDQKVLMDTSERAARALDKLVQRDDAKSYRSLLKRGITEVNMSKHKAAWDAAYKKTTSNLAGRVYSKDLLQAVKSAAGG